MTCIVGLAHNGKVYMGGDSMAAGTWDKHVIATRKVFRVGEFLIGYTSSFRMGQILQYHLSVPQQQDGVTDERYMVVDFVEAVRDCLKDKGYASVNSNVEEAGFFLVGYRGNLYYIASNFQVSQWASGIAAVGCGEPYALGAMVALGDKVKPKQRILKALEITSELCNGVCAPFYVETLNSNG